MNENEERQSSDAVNSYEFENAESDGENRTVEKSLGDGEKPPVDKSSHD
jgi:hypothetical protein